MTNKVKTPQQRDEERIKEILSLVEKRKDIKFTIENNEGDTIAGFTFNIESKKISHMFNCSLADIEDSYRIQLDPEECPECMHDLEHKVTELDVFTGNDEDSNELVDVLVCTNCTYKELNN